MDGTDIRTRFEALWSSRKVVEQSWDLVSRFVSPLYGGDFYREYVTEESVEYDRHRREIYDSTAVLASQNLAASIHGGLTTPLVRWFDLRFTNDEANENSEGAAWLEESSEIVWQELQESNFNLEANHVYLNLVSYGTGPIVEEAHEDSEGNYRELLFTAVPIREFYFEQDWRGRPLRSYRRLEWTPTQILSKFGEDGTPAHIIEMAESGQSVDQRVDVIYCVYAREGMEDIDPTQPRAPTQRAWGSKYILRSDGSQLGEEGGYYENPVFMPRWRTTAGSAWGHSPAMVCMGDILSLNDLVSMGLDALEKAVDPPSLVTERGLLSDLDLTAGGQTVVRTLDDMKYLESVSRVDWTALATVNLQTSIRSSFYTDQLELKESPAMTATEVQVRYELMQRLLGPTFGRLQSDFLDPLVVRTFYILLRAGQLPELPESLSSDGLKIEYLGPMSRAQKQERISSLERWVGFVSGMASANPAMQEAVDLIDPDKVGRSAGDLMGVRSDDMRSTAEVEAIRKERKQAQKKAQALAETQARGQAAQAVGAGAGAMASAGNELSLVEGGQ